jgi:Ca2+-transporting ATPase
MLVVTVSVSALTQLALVYVPFMQAVFQTAALKLSDLSIILALACTSFGLHEARRQYEKSVDAEETYVTEMEELA